MDTVLLVDADSKKVPNIALMKLAAHHKSQGDRVKLQRLNIQYYPNRKNTMHHIKGNYSKIYCSVIFEGSKEFIKGKGIIFGGTGHDLKTKLPAHIERLKPDYSIYPENDTSYGFISRGCIRKCKFCKVPEKEGGIKQVESIENIIQHKKVKFLDNNFLALPNHKELLKYLMEKKIRCQFNQGLDIRLVDKENSDLLKELNYMGEYIFAFDNWAYKNLIEKKLKLLPWASEWKLKFFVYCTPEEPIKEVVKRVKFLREKKHLPYIMRDKKCWGSENQDIYTDLAAWCNQVSIFKKLNFQEFLNKRHTKIERIEKSLHSYN